jgi:alkanesulfonate monooxygenase SsuD/methylene tetrahydromethanopterin reductase-like flavin-dependent oxidoreductase (luciferase family)
MAPVSSAPQIGVFLPSMGEPGRRPGDMAATARHAEDLGFESVWVIDQLIAGTGSPFLDSTVALATAAAVTSRIRLAYGVMILPLRPVAWAAKQVASLQVVSGDRMILGVGVGGDRHDRSWAAAGVSRRERGRRTDAALRVLAGLVAGAAVRLDDQPGQPVIQLAPGATVPPLVVGGMSDAAVTRAVDHGAGWFLAPGSPDRVRRARQQLEEVAGDRERLVPPITASLMLAMSGDPSVPSQDALIGRLTAVDGNYAIPADHLDDMFVEAAPAEVAERLAAFAEAGAQRVVATFVGGDWNRQTELLAEARDRLD